MADRGRGARALRARDTRGASDGARTGAAYLFVGAVGLALPFVLIAQALTVIDASTAAILNALSPLFATIVAALWIREPLTPAKLARHRALPRGHRGAGGLDAGRRCRRASSSPRGCSVLATALYGYTIVFTKVKLQRREPDRHRRGHAAHGGAALALAALHADRTRLRRDPGAGVARGAGPRARLHHVAFILYYRLIADVGPVKAITVTLLVPVFGMVWGVLFLGEPLTPGRIAGCRDHPRGLLAHPRPRALSRPPSGEPRRKRR